MKIVKARISDRSHAKLKADAAIKQVNLEDLIIEMIGAEPAEEGPDEAKEEE